MKMPSTYVAIIVVIAVAFPSWSQSLRQRMVIPAYFGFSSQQNNIDWGNLEQMGSGSLVAIAHFDELRGQEAQAKNAFSLIHDQLNYVYGYVDTAHGSRSKDNVLHGYDGLVSVDDWYRTYGS